MSDETPPNAWPSGPRHIVETMSDAAELPPVDPDLPKPMVWHPHPLHSNPVPLAVPRSIFNTSRPFKGHCSHLTMARAYCNDYVCDTCHRPGGFGWLYECTEQKELILEDDYRRRGYNVAFDPLGGHFCRYMSFGKWGPDARYDYYAVLKEMTEAQLHTYTPAQLESLLKHRVNVWAKAELDAQNDPDLPFGLNPSIHETGWVEAHRPWVPHRQECGYIVCHRCLSWGDERSALSLDGIANGFIPPTASVGYGFHYTAERPVALASVVSKLGYRAVPLPRRSQTQLPVPPSRGSSQVTVGRAAGQDEVDYDADWETTDDSKSDESDYRVDVDPEDSSSDV